LFCSVCQHGEGHHEEQESNDVSRHGLPALSVSVGVLAFFPPPIRSITSNWSNLRYVHFRRSRPAVIFYLLRTGAKSELIHINVRAFSELFALHAARPCSAVHLRCRRPQNHGTWCGSLVNVCGCAEPAGADGRAPRDESCRANAMPSRVTTRSARNSDRGAGPAGQFARRIGPPTSEGGGAFVDAANRGPAGAGI